MYCNVQLVIFSFLFFAGEYLYIVWWFFKSILYVQLGRIQQIYGHVFLQINFCIFVCQGSKELEKMCIFKMNKSFLLSSNEFLCMQ